MGGAEGDTEACEGEKPFKGALMRSAVTVGLEGTTSFGSRETTTAWSNEVSNPRTLSGIAKPITSRLAITISSLRIDIPCNITVLSSNYLAVARASPSAPGPAVNV